MEKSLHGNWMVGVLLCALMACGLYVRIADLAYWYWSPDDVFHLALAVHNSFAQTLHNSIDFDWVHPPLYILILHGFLKVSGNEYFLRSTSLLPGLGFIFLSYLAGLRAFGKSAGFFAAFVAAFGFGSVIISEVIRPYSLMLFFVMGGACCLFSYNQTPKRIYLYLYGLCALCASLLIYASTMCIAAVGIVWFCSLCYKKRYHDVLVWCAIHAIILTFFGLLFYYAIYPAAKLSQNFASAAETWLSNGYPGPLQFGLWLKNVKELFQYFFINSKAAIVFFLLFLAGCFYCWSRRQWEILAACICMFGINVVAALLKKFPFTPDRHCIYLLPFVLLVSSLPIQILADKWAKQCSAKILAALALVSMGICVFYIKENDFYRFANASILEFPVSRDEYNASLKLLTNTTEKTTVLTDTTAYYLLYESSFDNKILLTGQWYEIPYHNKEFYSFLPLTAMAYPLINANEIGNVIFKDLPQIQPVVPDSVIQFVSIGWCWNLQLGLFDMQSPSTQPKNLSTAGFLQSQKWYSINLNALKYHAVQDIENVNCSRGGGGVFVSVKPKRLDKRWFGVN
jgi:hypothetical protein